METQQTEYKQTWRDEFLKEICAFANAQGGVLYVGIDDNGKVVARKPYNLPTLQPYNLTTRQPYNLDAANCRVLCRMAHYE